MRAARYRFDPYAQVSARLRALHGNGHSIDKIELIVLGGTWSSYPERYRIGFVKRCFDAMNDFASRVDGGSFALREDEAPLRDHDEHDSRSSYNATVARVLRDEREDAWVPRAWPMRGARSKMPSGETKMRHVDRWGSSSKRGPTRSRRSSSPSDDSARRRCRSGAESFDGSELNARGHDVATSRRSDAAPP